MSIKPKAPFTRLLRHQASWAGGAFTLIELLLVIVVIAMLAALLLPALAGSKNQAQAAFCLNNLRQLALAVAAYAEDNQEFYPPNPDDGNIVPGHDWCAGQAGIGAAQEFDPDVLKDPSLTLVAPYLGEVTGVFRCPTDPRTGPYQGSDLALTNREVAATRTYSMNQAVGIICPGYDQTHSSHSGIPALSPNGVWLDYPQTQTRNAPWFTYGKTSDHSAAPGPAQLWILVEEDPASINDASFAFSMASPAWIDRPGTAHVLACSFAFADGHSEIHKWLSPDTQVIGGSFQPNAKIAAPYLDWLWMRLRTSDNRSGTFPPPPP